MKEYLQQLRGLWAQLGINQRVSLGLAVIAVIGGMAGLFLWARKPGMQLLYGRLAEKDAAEVVAAVQAANVPYELGAGGNSIFVPSTEVHKLRMQLAGKGIPSGEGVGFEVFDRPNFGISDFVQRTNYVRALQGELARTISQLSGVRSARVLIVLPENRLLFTDVKAKPTASVFIEGSVSMDGVNSIRSLVANAVEGLRIDDVSVVDNRGTVLTESLRDDPQLAAASGQMKMRKAVETYFTQKVETMLARVVGPGNAVVRVSAELDPETTTRMEEKFDPESQVVRNEQSTEDSTITTESTDTAGAVGATANLPGSAGGQSGGKAGGKNSEQTLKNKTQTYDINRTTLSSTRAPGGITRLTAAVVVAAKAQPRAATELDSLRRMVVNALGIKAPEKELASMVTVEEAPFEAAAVEKPGFAEVALGHTDLIKNAFAMLAAVGLIFFFFRTVKRAQPDRIPIELLKQNAEGTASLPAGGITPQLLNDMIQQKPENVSVALRNWMADNNG
jgi:flagellar M-ring protein FliF